MPILLILFLLFFPAQALGLLIVEVQTEGENTANDYIKIYNQSEEDINVKGYKLRKRTSSGNEYSIRVFPEGIIPPKEYFIWANSKNDFHLSVGADAWSTATIAKNNSIALFDDNDKLLDAVSWGENSKPFNEKGIPGNPGKITRKKSLNGYQNRGDNARDFYFHLQSKTEKEAIDINSASVEDLIEIIHIGKARAGELISSRPFYSFNDLTKIRGIGEKSAKDIKEEGLAWIDPAMKKEKTAPAEPIDYKSAPKESIPYGSVFSAVLVSAFSAGAVIFLKKNI